MLEREELLSMYDNPLGEVPSVPIGQFSHVDSSVKDGNVYTSSKSDSEINDVAAVASEVGAEVTPRPNGEYNSTVIKHKAWLWIGGALGAAMGLTAAGLGTAFAIEHHRRKNRKPTDK